nr:permease-like cell division protein FtsX [uncultured Oscillibacter sp.]
MGKHNLGYFLHEGVSNMFSHGFMSFAAIGITVACLLIMGTFTLVAVNANGLLAKLEQENEILAFVEEDYTPTQSRGVQRDLEAVPNVVSATYISKGQAMDTFAEKYAGDPLFQNLDPEILRDRYVIKIQDLALQSQTVEQLRQVEGVANVNGYEELATGFIAVRNIASVVCIALIAILFIVSVFIISNTIKLTTFDRREEIAIMRMVGATNGFIRWPFVYEGLLMGILSALLSFFFQWGFYEAVARGVDSSDTLQLIEIVPFQQLWPAVAVIFAVAGLMMGVGGSLSAIRKFLQV